MTDFMACGFGAITPDLILKSLKGMGAVTGQGIFRAEFYSIEGTSPVHCATNEDFVINLRRALDMGIDGKLILRINLNTENIGNSTCGLAETSSDILNSFFSEGPDGKVYFNLQNVGA